MSGALGVRAGTTAMGIILIWLLLLLLLTMGSYGIWESATATEFTAREIQTGRAKYRYLPKWYHRVFHFAISSVFLITAVAGILHLLRR